jgi:hypothetical protein
MKKTDFDNLPFDAAMRLYGLKLQAEKNNTIQLCTQRLRDHSALFDKETVKIFQLATCHIGNHKNMTKQLEKSTKKWYHK